MITPRRSDDRGRVDHGWLDARHSFSFGSYHDPAHMGFAALRVLNEDRIAPSGGFGTHPHRDMEIVTWVISGTLEHRDSTGGTGRLGAGEVQRMSAGTGITHSEVNPSSDEAIHLLQIWILPERAGITPSYEQRTVTDEELRNRWAVLVAPGGDGDALDIHADARFLGTRLDAGRTVELDATGRAVWLQVVSGKVEVGGIGLTAGDGAAVVGETALMLTASAGAEVVAVDMAS